MLYQVFAACVIAPESGVLCFIAIAALCCIAIAGVCFMLYRVDGFVYGLDGLVYGSCLWCGVWGLCFVFCVLCFVAYGVWCVVYGLWRMVYGVWCRV